MKKSFKIYSLIWAICLAVFNVITFVTPNEIGGVSKFSGSFWVGYIFITIAFIGQLVCAFFSFKLRNLKKYFYRIPLISVSYTGLVAMLIAGSVFMAVPALPAWIGIIVCMLILTFNAIAIIKATVAAEFVSGIDESIAVRTEFMQRLTARANTLMNQKRSEETIKIYEALRYSDPVDNPFLAECNSKLLAEFNAFADAVNSDDLELIKHSAASLMQTIEARNLLCKTTK